MLLHFGWWISLTKYLIDFLKFKSWIYLYKCIHNYERSQKNNVIMVDTIKTKLFKKNYSMFEVSDKPTNANVSNATFGWFLQVGYTCCSVLVATVSLQWMHVPCLSHCVLCTTTRDCMCLQNTPHRSITHNTWMTFGMQFQTD